MAFFLFHPRIANLTAPSSIRPGISLNLLSKYGLVRTIVTKTKGNSKPLLMTRWPPPLKSFPNSRWVSSRASVESRTLKALRILCLAGGFVFWSCVGVCAALSTAGLLKFRATFAINKFRYEEPLTTHDINLTTTHPLMAKRLVTLYQLFEDSDELLDAETLLENKADELRLKRVALFLICTKLRKDEGFRSKFGEEVKFSVIDARDNPEGLKKDSHKNKDRWKACVYAVGSNLSALVTVEFHKVAKGQMEVQWIPVSLLVEEIPNSIIKICDISGPLPNGISKFTRLVND